MQWLGIYGVVQLKIKKYYDRIFTKYDNKNKD